MTYWKLHHVVFRNSELKTFPNPPNFIKFGVLLHGQSQSLNKWFRNYVFVAPSIDDYITNFLIYSAMSFEYLVPPVVYFFLALAKFAGPHNWYTPLCLQLPPLVQLQTLLTNFRNYILHFLRGAITWFMTQLVTLEAFSRTWSCVGSLFCCGISCRGSLVRVFVLVGLRIRSWMRMWLKAL